MLDIPYAIAGALTGFVVGLPRITLDEMIQEMVAHDLDTARQQALLKSSGFKVSVGRE